MEIAILIVIIVSYFMANLFQNKISDGLHGRISPANLFQTTWMLFAIAVFIMIGSINGGLGFSKTTVCMGSIAGVCNVAGGLCLLGALATGPLSITILIFSMYVIVPTILAVAFLGEGVTIAQIAGVILILIVLCLSNLGGKKEKTKKSSIWWLLCIGSVFGIGLSSFMMKVHQYQLPNQEIWEYSICNYAMGAFIGIIAACFFSRKEKKAGKEPFHFHFRNFFGPAIGMALSEGIANLGNLYNASRIPAIILYPVTQLGTLMITVLFGVLFLKEKLTRVSTLCLLLGMTAILLMNF